MKNLLTHSALHLSSEQMLTRSRWFGPNLITFLATAEETGGAYTLIKHVIRKGFEPPLHVHSREDESHVILEGEIMYEVGEQHINARTGDYVLLPRDVPHTFKLISDKATLLLIINPSGFEKMFMQFSRPALSMELPPVPTTMPGPKFFAAMNQLNTELGVTMVPTL